MAATEQDAEDDTRVIWTEIGRAARLHLYPAVGDSLTALTSESHPGPVLLPPITDQTFRWR
ncbi:MAG TPA: hypothetical protein VMG38_13450 [Trebonia sp.]|nr:hypothetical protein [Trebonia sp.]